MSKYQKKVIEECGYEPKSYPCLLIKKEISDILISLPAIDRAVLFTAMSDYHWTGKVPENLSPMQQGVFITLKHFIDRNIHEYVIECKKKAENRAKGWPKKDE